MNLQQSSSRHCDKAFARMKADFMIFLLSIDWWWFGSDVLRYNLDSQWPLYMWWWLRRCFRSDWLTDRWSWPAEAAASSLRARLNWTTHLLCHLHHISKSGWYCSPKNIHIYLQMQYIRLVVSNSSVFIFESRCSLSTGRTLSKLPRLNSFNCLHDPLELWKYKKGCNFVNWFLPILSSWCWQLPRWVPGISPIFVSDTSTRPLRRLSNQRHQD